MKRYGKVKVAEDGPYEGRWVSPLFDNVSGLKIGYGVSNETEGAVNAAVLKSQGWK